MGVAQARGMPELPEVETVRRGLAERVVGARISAVQVHHPRSVRRQPGGAEAFAALLTGRTIRGSGRRGKFLWLELDDPDLVLAAHLGMSGQFRLGGALSDPHERVTIQLEGASRPGGGASASVALRFVDQRTFGWVAAEELVVDRYGLRVPLSVAGVARDALDPALDVPAAVAEYRRRSAAIKSLLLDQGIVAGIGNIYADEALWAARIHPSTPGDRLSARRLRALLAAAQDVMRASLAAGGTSFDRLYVNVNGSSGYYARDLSAYGRTGLPCPRCGRPIQRASFGNRSSHFCSYCQRSARRGTLGQ